ncbi:MAG: non-canonical purine NTP pyrophosphatase [Thermomicrobiales bacterium]
MIDQVLFVSSNRGKAREIESILGRPVEQLDLDIPEIQALDVETVVREKARAAYNLAQRPVLVEDTGLYIDALHGLPGAFVRWFLVTIGAEGICHLVPTGAPRGVTGRTAVGWCDGERLEIFTGETRGEIMPAPAGSGGFGWDPIFRPEGANLTFAEMTMEEKHRFSMRRQALDRFLARLG